MNYKTHSMGGLLLGTLAFGIVASKLNIDSNIISVDGAVFIASSLAGSFIPDIDHKGSYIGRRAKMASSIVSGVFGHRGATHSPLVMLGITGILYLLFSRFIYSNPLVYIGFIGLYVGIASHILLDFLTVAGVPLLHPFTKKKFSLLKASSGGAVEFITFALMAVASSYLIINDIVLTIQKTA